MGFDSFGIDSESIGIRFSIVCWDPSAAISVTLPLAEMPVHIADFDTKFLMRAVDIFMSEAHPYIKVLICDSHKSHTALRRIMFGMPTDADKILLYENDFKFLSKLKFQDLPEHDLPRLPTRLVTFEGEAYHLMPGCCGSAGFQSFEKEGIGGGKDKKIQNISKHQKM